MSMPGDILVYCPSEEDIINPKIRTRKRNPSGAIHYHCPAKECKYSPDKDRWFSTMKHLKQHFHKVHTAKVNCEKCKSVVTLSHMQQHQKTCGRLHSCPEGCADFISRSALVMHCSRKHPALHQAIIKKKYTTPESNEDKDKDEFKTGSVVKKCRDQGTQIEKRTKRPKTNLSPKPKAVLTDTFTQTITKSPPTKPENVKTTSSTQTNIKLSLDSRSLNKYCGDDSNSIQTQTALDELVYSNDPPDDLLLTESVYLSDTQTQTWPLSFNHDSAISIETQTIENMFDFGVGPTWSNGPFPTDSPSLFSSSETQTERRNGLLEGPRHNVLLSSIKSETGACFDESLIDSPKNFSEGGDF